MIRRSILTAVFICSLVVVGSAATSSATTTHHRHIISSRWYAPLLTLPKSWQSPIDCLIHHESTSTRAHPNLGDDNGNGENTVNGQSSGIFQMNNGSNGVWDLYAKPTLHVDISRATALQQAEGFVLVLRRDGGFHPWHGDGCVYPN
jgi:hypothetical protein